MRRSFPHETALSVHSAWAKLLLCRHCGRVSQVCSPSSRRTILRGFATALTLGAVRAKRPPGMTRAAQVHDQVNEVSLCPFDRHRQAPSGATPAFPSRVGPGLALAAALRPGFGCALVMEEHRPKSVVGRP